MELVIKKVSPEKCPGLDGSTGEFHQTNKNSIKEEIISILHKLFQKMKYQEILCNSFYDVIIFLISKMDRNYERKLQSSIS